MAAEKKRLSKRAKAVAKLLNDSQLLAAKTASEAKPDATFEVENQPVKTSAANKMRPDKKRG